MTTIPPPHDDIHPRRPFVAALLSLALPGLGQLYNGEVNKALWLFLGFVLIGAPGETIAALYVPAALMLPLLVVCVLLTFGVWLYAIADAWRSARNRQIYTRREWQVSGLYALLFITGNAAILSLFVDTVRPHQVEPFRIPSASMEPSILKGDFLLADKRYNCPNCKGRVEAGDIGLFVYPNDRTAIYIKRVIGLPGDHVTIKGHEVAVNGKSLTREESVDGERIVVTEQSGERSWRVQWDKNAAGADVDVTVPPGQIFLLGDNRDNTTDSRKFGAVPLPDLVGRARQIWFSKGESGVRWERLGKVVE
ncbi:MAG: signal peptidase I [Methylocella sp.]